MPRETVRVNLGPVSPSDVPDRAEALRRVRAVIDRLVRDGTAVAPSDGTTHGLFPVAASAAEGKALQEWVTRDEPDTRSFDYYINF